MTFLPTGESVKINVLATFVHLSWCSIQMTVELFVFCQIQFYSHFDTKRLEPDLPKRLQYDAMTHIITVSQSRGNYATT